MAQGKPQLKFETHPRIRNRDINCDTDDAERRTNFDFMNLADIAKQS